MSKILVTGASGFIGHWLVKQLVEDGHFVRAVDIKRPEYSSTVVAEEFDYGCDLRVRQNCMDAVRGMDEVYHLAADMGGIGWITTHHAEILCNSLRIDTNMVDCARLAGIKKFLFSSSACVYPEYNQETPDAPPLKECDVYPALPENAYGWGKLTTEKLLEHYRNDYGLNTRVTRFHNVYGPEETWDGGREKAPAALARKIALAKMRGENEIQVWGDGKRRRSFVYVTDVVKGLSALMASDYQEPVNIGNDYTVSINELAQLLMDAAEYPVNIKHVQGALGVQGRNSDNTLAHQVLPNWRPTVPIREGLNIVYKWVEKQVRLNYSATGID
jgi:GDP-D-mannose 3',5'-epimerase